MPTHPRFFAEIASRYGVDPGDPNAVSLFFKEKLPALELRVRENILEELLDLDGVEPTQSTIALERSAQTKFALRGKNLLSADVELRGSIKFCHELFIDGKVEGEIISADGVLTIGENAEIRAEIRTKSVVVYGKVYGNITVEQRCEMKGRATLMGHIRASRLLLEDGVTFVGNSEVVPHLESIHQTAVVRPVEVEVTQYVRH